MGCGCEPEGGLLVIDAVGWRSMYFVVMPTYLFITCTLRSSTRALFVNCLSLICLPSMLYLYGETPLVNCGPRSYFPYCYINQNQRSVYFSTIYFSATILHPLNTFNPLCSAKLVSLTTSLNSWGKVIYCLCAGFQVALTPVEAPCHCQPATPSVATPFSYWSIKPSFYY